MRGDHVLSPTDLDPNHKDSGPIPFLNAHCGILLSDEGSKAGGVTSSLTGDLKSLQSQVQDLYKIASRYAFSYGCVLACELSLPKNNSSQSLTIAHGSYGLVTVLASD